MNKLSREVAAIERAENKKMRDAIAAVRRAQQELFKAASLTVGFGRESWLYTAASDLGTKAAELAEDFETFKTEVAR